MKLKTWTRQLSLRTLSLQQRLPVLISLLLVAVMIIFTIVSYYSVRRVTVKNAEERLEDISEQMTTLYSRSAQSMMFTYRAFAAQPEITGFIKTKNDSLKPAILAGLQKMTADSLIALMELVDANFEPLLINTKAIIEQYVNIDSVRRVALTEDTAIVGQLRVFSGQLYHSIQMPVREKGIIGYLISWRKVGTTRATLDQFSKLLGADARLYVGNVDGDTWTDFSVPVSPPLPKDQQLTGETMRYRSPEGDAVFARATRIANSPWVLVVEFPKHKVLAPAYTFLKWIIIIGALLNIIAFFVTWKMSRKLTSPLRQLTNAATTIASGKKHEKVSVDRYDEIGKLARAFNTMVNKVSHSKVELEKKVEETEQMTRQLRELSAHLQNIREEERIHIAREMHDELGQLLTGFKMDVSWLHKKLSNETDPVVKEKLEEMMQVINDAARFVRKLASELRPSILDDLGLIPALDWHSQEFQRRSNIHVEFCTALDEINTSKDVATGLFRMYQESLTNVARHADARKVKSELELVENDIRLTITDDGKGFDTKTGERKTLGILGMKERAAMLGGQLKIYSAPGKGTTVLISVPKHQAAYTPA